MTFSSVMKTPFRTRLGILIGGGLLGLSIAVWSSLSPRKNPDDLAAAQTHSREPERLLQRDDAGAKQPVGARPPSAELVGASWQERWTHLSGATASPERTLQRAALLKELAGNDPHRAISLARLESDQEARQSLFQALLEGWAAREMDKAGEWALQQDDLHHDLAMSAVFNGGGHRPEAVLQLAQRLSAQYPDRAQDYGSYLIFSLSRAGAYQQAADFASGENSGADPGWIISAYSNWARQQPEVAVLAATDLDEPEQRSTAFRAAIYAWAETDPKALVEYAEGFPEGEEKSFALVAALRAWRQREPQAAKAWMAKSGPIPGMKTIEED